MAQTAFGLTDLFDAGILLPSSFAFQQGTPWENVQRDSPGVQAAVSEGLVNQGWFEVGSSNKWVDVDEGSGDVAVAFADGYYRVDELRDLVATALNGAAGLSDIYTVTWLNGVFSIGSSGTFSISWKTGSHGTDNSDNSIAEEMGFDESADTSTAGSHVATSKRYSTAVGFWFDLGSTKKIAALVWYAEGGDDVTASFDDVKLFVDSAFRGWHRDAWVDASSTTIQISARSAAQTVNQIQVGFQDPDTATARRYGFVSWRHWDESQDHRVGLIKAFAAVRDNANSRTIGPVRDHLPFQAANPRNLGDYYAPTGIIRWRATLTFPAWEVASWKEVVLSIVAHGLHTGVLWVEDFDSLKANTIATTLSDTNLGRVLWATVQSVSGGDASGQQDSYRTSTVSIEQLR